MNYDHANGIVTEEHSESANLRQGQNLTGG